MTLVYMPNKVFALNMFVTALPEATNHGLSIHLLDTVLIPKVCQNTLACDLLSTARRRVPRASPVANRWC